MSAIRTDPLTGALTYIVPERQKRPNNTTTSSCPFCPGGLEAKEHYEVKSFVNRWPAMGENRCEVVLFGPDHCKDLAYYDIGHLLKVISLWQERLSYFYKRQDISYVLIFENRGSEVGATISHPHGQIYAFDFLPPIPKAELERTLNYGCSLCKTSDSDYIVYSNDAFSLICPAWSAWPYELLAFSNEHVSDMIDEKFNSNGFAEVLMKAVRALDQHFEGPVPYMFFIHQYAKTDRLKEASHLHAHFLPIWREKNVKRFVAAGELGSGVMFNPVDPKKAASSLQKTLKHPTSLS